VELDEDPADRVLQPVEDEHDVWEAFLDVRARRATRTHRSMPWFAVRQHVR
jgi:hypothetical protein